jgi:hypothetical protein
VKSMNMCAAAQAASKWIQVSLDQACGSATPVAQVLVHASPGFSGFSAQHHTEDIEDTCWWSVSQLTLRWPPGASAASWGGGGGAS